MIFAGTRLKAAGSHFPHPSAGQRRPFGKQAARSHTMPDFPSDPLAEDLARAKSPEDFHDALRRALASYDELGAQIVEGAGLKLACFAGCSLCCSLRVDVHAHEVFFMAQHVREHFTDAELAALLARLAVHSAKVLPLTPYDHATQNTVCPLLQDGRCSIYEARPHSCRRHHSLDFTACQFTYDHPTDLEAPAAHDRELFRTLTAGLLDAAETYARLGCDDTIYELGTALAEALDTPSSWERWRDGKKAFLRASVTPSA